MPSKIPLVEIIKRAENVHGKGRYDYSAITEENYKGIVYKYDIKCNVCGKVNNQKLSNHISLGRGCPECGKEKAVQDRRIGKEKFIERAKEVHGDKYDYSLVDYKNIDTNVLIKCNDCDTIFPQTPNHHIHGNGCPECAKKRRCLSQVLDTEIFIKRGRDLYGNKYDYSKVKYVNTKTDILIKCNDCDYEFKVTPNEHLNAHMGCPICTKGSYMNTEVFIKKAKMIFGDLYDYSKVEYVSAKTPVIMICEKHGEFLQTPDKHLNLHRGCPHCKASNGEKETARLLELKNIKFITEYKFADCKDINSLPFDFYLPDYNICIEYDGIQHYEPLEVFGGEKQFINQQKHDSIKTNYCKQNNIPLLRIKYDEDIETSLNQFLYNKCKIEPQSIFDL